MRPREHKKGIWEKREIELLLSGMKNGEEITDSLIEELSKKGMVKEDLKYLQSLNFVYWRETNSFYAR